MESKDKNKFSIKTLEIAGFASAFKALRLPYGLECRSKLALGCQMCYPHNTYNFGDYMVITGGSSLIDSKDLKLLSTLVKRGDEHSKCVRGIVVYAEINAPIWFYRELEAYRIGRERLSSESTMHIECKGLSGEELEKAKDEIPMGHYQKTVDMFSYQTLRRIYYQRKDHRLPMWREFCKWIESLPFFEYLIIPEYEDIK